MTQKPLALWGVMGTGKSTLGARCAARLGWPFYDLDRVIEEKEKTSIAEIFRQRGEEYFRALERQVARELLEGRRVIALGGGSLLDPEIRALYLSRAHVVRLEADTDALVARLAPTRETRPLLAGEEDLAARISALKEARREALSEIPLSLDTSPLSPERAADALLQKIFPARTHTVALGEKQHPYRIGPGLLGALGEELLSAGARGRVFLLVDRRAFSPHRARIIAALSGAGLRCEVMLLPAGEKTKTAPRLLWAIRQLAKRGADRGAFLLGLGGGAACDFTALLAALYMRGVRFALVPTTALAMLDAAIGAKSAINDKGIKNLIGVFSVPERVIADPTALATLPLREKRAALAEAVKSALIGDPALLSFLEESADRPGILSDNLWWCEVIERAARVKLSVLKEDPWEKGRRKLLNLGHTIGHAIELQSRSMRHGEAVSVGLVAALSLAEKRGVCEKDFAARITRLLRAFHLPTRAPRLDLAKAKAALRLDKKREEGKLTFVLPRAPGDVALVSDVSPEELEQALLLVGEDTPLSDR